MQKEYRPPQYLRNLYSLLFTGKIHTFCTYFHGSLLSKNPELADRLIKIALEQKYDKVELSPLDDSLEYGAKGSIIKRYKKSQK